MKNQNKIIVAVTGASGSLYARLLIQRLQTLVDHSQVAVILSKTAQKVWQYELDSEPHNEIPFPIYQPDDLFAPPASGSARFAAMIICPCSMGTIGRIAAGISDDLLTRAADVQLKERRRLIIVPRETPLSSIHLQNMQTLTSAGAIICPASPSFYQKPQTINDLALTVVDRALHLAGFEFDSYQWGQS